MAEGLWRMGYRLLNVQPGLPDDRLLGSYELRPCPKCGGSGQDRATTTMQKAGVIFDCPDCGGTGDIQASDSD